MVGLLHLVYQEGDCIRCRGINVIMKTMCINYCQTDSLYEVEELNLTRGSWSWQLPFDALLRWPLSISTTSSKPTSAGCIRNGRGWLWVAEDHGQLSRIHSAMSCHCDWVVSLPDYNRHNDALSSKQNVFHTIFTPSSSLTTRAIIMWQSNDTVLCQSMCCIITNKVQLVSDQSQINDDTKLTRI